MKKFFTFALIAFGLLAMQTAQAQCSDKTIKKATKEGLGTYIFESAAFKPLSSFGSNKEKVEAAFSVYSQESYRVLNLCQGFGAVPEFIIYDSDKTVLFNSAKEGGKNAFDFVAQKSGDYTISFKVSAADQKANNSCIAFAIGYK